MYLVNKIVNNDRYNFLQPELMSSSKLFNLINSPKPKLLIYYHTKQRKTANYYSNPLILFKNDNR